MNSHRLLVARGKDLVLLDWNHEDATFYPDSANLTFITSVANEKGLEGNVWNEAKADVKGRLWAGTIGFDPTMKIKTKNKAALYVLNPNSSNAEKVVGNISISNSLAWNPENTLMYYIDSSTRRIDVFDYDVERGLISNRRELFDFKENNISGNPDGIIIDNKGNLWITCFFGGIVINVDPRTRTLIRTLEFPTTLVTSVTWGGPKLDVLYVTTSQVGLSEEQKSKQPLAGAVFTVSCLGAKANAPAYLVVRGK
ncbi:Regucalcin [Blattella germanica]|nr:Regucalcin [Blattella germanica]